MNSLIIMWVMQQTLEVLCMYTQEISAVKRRVPEVFLYCQVHLCCFLVRCLKRGLCLAPAWHIFTFCSRTYNPWKDKKVEKSAFWNWYVLYRGRVLTRGVILESSHHPALFWSTDSIALLAFAFIFALQTSRQWHKPLANEIHPLLLVSAFKTPR